MVYCLLRIRRGPEMAPLRVRSVEWRRGRRPVLVLASTFWSSQRTAGWRLSVAFYRILYLLSSQKKRQKVAKIKAESMVYGRSASIVGNSRFGMAGGRR